MSWAAMAGVSYQITPSIAIDLGYRYLSLGDAMGGTSRRPNRVTTFKNLSANEFRHRLPLHVRLTHSLSHS